jgi:integrase
MARRKTLTDNMVEKMKSGPKRLTLPDPELRGHYLRITPAGAKSYVAVARDPGGKQVWATVGSAEVFKIDEARDKAREAIKRIKAGQPAFEPPPVKPDSFKAVAENYLERHVRAKGLRSQAEIERILDKYIYPVWRDREFVGIRRGDVTSLLDGVQDANGPRQADYVLAIVRGLMNWYMSRTDDYVSPIARGMRRTDPKSRKRARILDDDELRTVWKIAEGNGTFGAILRLAVLTAQRREKLATMRWDDITVDGVWSIPAEDREKGNGGVLVLPDAAVDIIRAQNRVGENPYVFAGRADGHFNAFSPCKRAFDAKVTKVLQEAADDPEAVKPLPGWQVHDLRRTARSLMSRAGVRPDVAERVMGHAIEGIEGVYDRHSYRDEKADALNKLAGLVALILDPPADNVAELHGGA